MKFHLLFIVFLVKSISAQFAPPPGNLATTAMHKDSSAFVNWANSCVIERGYQDISNVLLGFASVGDSVSAIGAAGNNGVVSLGDGGYAILQFPIPIKDMPGNDFAIFENSFSDDYLELAFVEVSSDGINYFRFNATSNTQDTLQTTAFGLTNATKLNNLAGKYRAHYGTPFNLNELAGNNGLDITNITHVKIIDVIGSISTYPSYDKDGNKINDPWPTPFPSAGFDLDAVGVINQNTSININEDKIDKFSFNCFYSVDEFITVSYTSLENNYTKIEINDIFGKKLQERKTVTQAGEFYNFNFKLETSGVYLVNLYNNSRHVKTIKIIAHIK